MIMNMTFMHDNCQIEFHDDFDNDFLDDFHTDFGVQDNFRMIFMMIVTRPVNHFC